MVSRAFTTALAKDLPVLFVFIGWARRYDGSEAVTGAHAWLKRHPKKNWEAEAFKEQAGRQFASGIGPGDLQCKGIHIVFVARDPMTKRREVVGIYAAAEVNTRARVAFWRAASTRHAKLIEYGERPNLP